MEGWLQKEFWVISARLSTAALLAVFILLGLPLLVAAQEPEVVINELMWDGLEYVELLNTTSEVVNLSGWSLTRQKPNGEVKEIVEFAEGDVIGAKGYYLIEEKEEATTVEAEKITSKLVLVNTGEQVTLLDAKGVVVDQANQLGAWLAGENTTTGVSMERKAEWGDGTSASSWHSSTGEAGGRTGTPGIANSVPTVNIPPEAALSGPGEGLVGEELLFTAEDSSDADEDGLVFDWTFGDGEAGDGIEVIHEFSEAGTYEVEVTVSDGEARDVASLLVGITLPSYSDKIVINEFLPNPEGPDSEGEFIELRNTGSEVVDLSGWQLDDGEGGSVAYTIESTDIVGGGIKLFNRTDTKIALNNTGDSVRLLDPTGEIKSSYSYDSADEGYSYNRNSDGEYVVSTTPTPGDINKVTAVVDEDAEEENEEELDSEGEVMGDSAVKVLLADVRDEKKGMKVEVEGVVSAPPGVFGEKTVYLAGSGVQVYFSQEEWPDLKLGDVVSLVGEVSSVRGETRLKLAQADDVQVVRSGEPPEPHVVKTGEVDEDKEGWLVTVQGHVSKTSGDTFYIDDGSGEVKVYIKESTGIEKPKMKKGMAVTVTGVVSETSSGYRVLPRWQEDIRLGLVAGMTSFPATGLRQGYGRQAGPSGYVGLVLWVLICLFVGGWVEGEPLLRQTYQAKTNW